MINVYTHQGVPYDIDPKPKSLTRITAPNFTELKEPDANFTDSNYVYVYHKATKQYLTFSKNQLLMMMNRKIYIDESNKKGLGLFASERIYEGEPIHVMSSEFPKHNISDIQVWNRKEIDAFLEYAFQIDEKNYYGDPTNLIPDASFLMNHSCDPNSWYVDDSTIVASRVISPNEEITMDYGTIMYPQGLEDHVINCKCGAINCRTVITKEDCLLSEFQERYKGHLLSFISKYIA